jgi:transposase-like protein
MISRKQAVLQDRTVCPICRSSRVEPLNKTREGNTRMSCRSCGCVYEVPTDMDG